MALLSPGNQQTKLFSSMQSYRALTRLPIQQASRRLIRPKTARKMSLWPRSALSSEPSFGSLFRLLDEFDNYHGGSVSGKVALPKGFNPKFDIKENKGDYELHGELPGVDQKNVNIEFTDANTLTIRGHVERSYEEGTPPKGSIEGPSRAGAIEGKKPHKATVEDEGGSAVQQTTQQQAVQKQPETSGAGKIWVSERSVGDFSRSFSFPDRVDQDHVHASMKNGILSVVVPKAKKAEARKIPIS
ncbi:uncharacterized protein BP5553_07742 [Venustampulla echinocandica]|uniref:SHSP domain-containing protein n=1 Tax=Venustampulla echinocandica TaxID=2656787 RepID=A0A370THD9_9HELO|nr:uncharacterized protein BP5553_07742 [Venustampulla echinocandica]RDL34614.1 hypothetical protein BP5553_07742 [Venustampulla echinocandica]